MALFGPGVIAGGVVSTVLMVWTHDEELPEGSVAVQVRVIVTVPPQPGVLTSTCVTVGVEQLSTAVAVPVAAGVVLAGHSSTTPAGQVIAGAVVSITFTVAEQVAERPPSSVTVSVTDVAPSAYGPAGVRCRVIGSPSGSEEPPPTAE